jgi:hypothetical protein
VAPQSVSKLALSSYFIYWQLLLATSGLRPSAVGWMAMVQQRLPEGPANKNRRNPRAFAKSQTHPPAIRFFFSTFLGVPRQGGFKNTTEMFLQKAHVENFPQKNRQKFRCQVSLDFFVLRVFRCFSAMGVQKHTKKRFTKNIVSKKNYK